MPAITLNISPQTNVRSVQGDKIFFRIPEDKLRPDGLKRKRRLERYNQYKLDLFDIANDIGFKVPVDDYHWIMFFIPMPKSWRKWQREKHNGRPHQQKPDKDNLEKAFYDALLPKVDNSVWDSRLTKIWTDSTEGHIEIVWGDSLSNY